MTTIDDELAAIANDAMEADTRPQRPPRVYGQVTTLDIWRCVLETGAGKVPFDPAVHQSYRMRNYILIEIQRLRDGRMYKKDYLDRDNRDDKGWSKITLPSLNAIGGHLATLKYRWCCVEIVPTGKTWKNSDGETIANTTFKFIEFYPTRDACEAAELIWYGSPTEDTSTNTPATDELTELPPASAATNSDHNVGVQAAKALWTASGKDEAKFKKMLDSNPSVKNKFPGGVQEALDVVNGT